MSKIYIIEITADSRLSDRTLLEINRHLTSGKYTGIISTKSRTERQ